MLYLKGSKGQKCGGYGFLKLKFDSFHLQSLPSVTLRGSVEKSKINDINNFEIG